MPLSLNFDFQYEVDPYEIELFNSKHPAVLSVGNLQLRPYALCVTLAVLCGLLLLWYTGRRAKLKTGTVSTLAVLLLPLGFLFARLFYIIDRLDWYENIGLEKALHFWEGGYALWGAVLGCVLSILLASRISRERVSALFDACAAPAALVISLCRFAEFPCCGEGYGPEISPESFFCRFPFAVQLEEDYGCLAVFFFEGIAALIILAVLLRSRRTGGDKARLFLILYSSAQILLESLRRDHYLLLFTHEFIRASQIVAAAVLVGLIVAALIRRARKQSLSSLSPGVIICMSILFVLGIGIVIGMEFAKDKLPALPIWACYAIMAVGCVMLGFSSYKLVLPVRRKEKTI